jgi:hypothetical protein
MMKFNRVVVTAVGAGMLFAGTLWAQPFGGSEDVAYAKQLWSAMQSAGLLGNDGIMSTPYKGQHPHGAVLDTIETELSLGGNNGVLIVKRNYGGEGVSKSAVADDPGKFLKAVTVMYKRKGYDADNKDWFWAKYLADGSLDKNPKGMLLAGRVAKGAPQGCIACHTAAPGGDMVFNNDRYR